MLTEGKLTYLYTGFSGRWDKDRSGSMAVVLDEDMLTVLESPVCVVVKFIPSRGSIADCHGHNGLLIQHIIEIVSAVRSPGISEGK